MPQLHHLHTPHHGPVVYDAHNIFCFAPPPLGLPELERFLILDKDGITWLQSIDNVWVALCCIDPFAVTDFDLEIGYEDAAAIAANDAADIQVLVPVTLNRNPELTKANLHTPILIGRSSRRATQLLLENARTPRYLTLAPIDIAV